MSNKIGLNENTPEIKRVTLHPLKADGSIDLDINLYPKTLLDGIVDREGKPVEVQEKLIDGETIKTINGESIVGKGNIKIEGGEIDPAILDGKLNVVDGVAENLTVNKALTVDASGEDVNISSSYINTDQNITHAGKISVLSGRVSLRAETTTNGASPEEPSTTRSSRLDIGMNDISAHLYDEATGDDRVLFSTHYDEDAGMVKMQIGNATIDEQSIAPKVDLGLLDLDNEKFRESPDLISLLDGLTDQSSDFHGEGVLAVGSGSAGKNVTLNRVILILGVTKNSPLPDTRDLITAEIDLSTVYGDIHIDFERKAKGRWRVTNVNLGSFINPFAGNDGGETLSSKYLASLSATLYHNIYPIKAAAIRSGTGKPTIYSPKDLQEISAINNVYLRNDKAMPLLIPAAGPSASWNNVNIAITSTPEDKEALAVLQSGIDYLYIDNIGDPTTGLACHCFLIKLPNDGVYPQEVIVNISYSKE